MSSISVYRNSTVIHTEARDTLISRQDALALITALDGTFAWITQRQGLEGTLVSKEDRR